jgi:hypothetical protein
VLNRPIDIYSYFPPVVAETKEIKHISNALTNEFKRLQKARDETYKNQYVSILEPSGCKRWEKMLNIPAKQTDSIETRRMRIASQLVSEIPYTKETLKSILTSLCGENGYFLEIDHANLNIVVELELIVKEQQSIVESTLDRIIPANMTLSVSLRYATHEELAKYTHGQLAAYTHDELRNKALR